MIKIKQLIERLLPTIEFVSLILLISFIPLILKVNFMQNDDWNRTSSVARFLTGDFKLLTVTATTFYTQGIMGMLFSLIFGIKRLPLLTLLVSVLNFYIFARILYDHFNLSKGKSILLSLMLFFTPLHMYSMIGFMTENYVLLFILTSLYFLLSFEKTKKWKYFGLFNLSSLLGFYAKQSGALISIAALPYFLIKKRYREAFYQFIFLALLIGYYSFLFPKTDEMGDKVFIRGVVLNHLLNYKYAFSLVYGIILVVSSFILPVLVYLILITYKKVFKNKISLLLLLIAGFACLIFLNKAFDPRKLSWAEYPYFENTFERTGFFPRSILGTKYQFKGNYKFFTYMDITAKVSMAFLLPCLLLYRKKLVNIYSISIVFYIFSMIFVKSFFDRYNLILIPLFILFLMCFRVPEKIEGRLLNIVVTPFLLLMIFVSTQLSIDFVLSNNYIWTKSEQLVSSGIKPSEIRATMAWGKYYGLCSNCRYVFSFDSFAKNSSIEQNFNLIEEHNVTFPGSIFIDSKIYLYQSKINYFAKTFGVGSDL